MKLVYILNGAPASGKDTLGGMLREKHNVRLFKFATELRKEVAAYYKIPLALVDNLVDNRDAKDSYHPVFDCTPRQALQLVSEDVIKQLYGRDYFGERLADYINEFGSDVNVVTDGGFLEEIQPIAEQFDTHVVRLYRKGCTFDGDTRGYIPDYYGLGAPYQAWDIYNIDGCVDTMLHHFESIALKLK